jgi:hypothetical protein
MLRDARWVTPGLALMLWYRKLYLFVAGVSCAVYRADAA